MDPSLHVGFLAAEAVPLVKVGGLADVAGALPRELERLGARVTLVLPGYRSLEAAEHALRPLPGSGGQVQVGARSEPFTIDGGRLPGTDVCVLVVRGRLFDRDGIYVDPRTGLDHADQVARWVFFNRAALAALDTVRPRLDVLHLNDYHTALATAYARLPGRQPVPTLFSIHNLGYQGLHDAEAFALTGLPPAYMQPLGPFEFWGRMNLLKAGLVLADRLTTVSPTYALEIQESDVQGCGLEGVLRGRGADLVGILNGIDTRVWNPATDPHLAARYDRDRLEAKETCKRALLARVGLPYTPGRPLLGCISRLATQKGFDLLLEAMDGILARELQLVILGAGDVAFERALGERALAHPEVLSFQRSFDEPLAHAIEAGADFFLMPSRYEPCGLNQMYSLAYGTVPVVRRTGGLADTVRDWEGAQGEGTGIVFEAYTPAALLDAIARAQRLYSDPAALRRVRRAGMAQDVSWARSASRYLEVYRELARPRAVRAPSGGD